MAGAKRLLQLLVIEKPADAVEAAGVKAHGEDRLRSDTGHVTRSFSSSEARGTSRRSERMLSSTSVSLVGTDLVIIQRAQIEQAPELAGTARGPGAKDIVAEIAAFQRDSCRRNAFGKTVCLWG